ncbi:MAG: hypothetical protein MUC97_17990, partial [Bernardetiaceae bacterium]|nr:hypothetical protein [Bernardetiaceae bacterium]
MFTFSKRLWAVLTLWAAGAMLPSITQAQTHLVSVTSNSWGFAGTTWASATPLAATITIAQGGTAGTYTGTAPTVGRRLVKASDGGYLGVVSAVGAGTFTLAAGSLEASAAEAVVEATNTAG